jgi:hypothetical protein
MKHYSYCTEKTYVQWVRRYILFHAQGNRFSSDHLPTLPPNPRYGSTRLQDRPASQLIDPEQLGGERLG